MSEKVTITPLAGRRDSDGDAVGAGGTPFTLNGLVAPGNTVERRGTGGETEKVDFTFLTQQPRVKIGVDFVPVETALTDNFDITIRGARCRGRLQKWSEGGLGGLVIVATSATGKGGA